MDACVVSSTFLVHVGNNCIRVVAEISIMDSGMDEILAKNGNRHFLLSDHACGNSIMDQGIRQECGQRGCWIWTKVSGPPEEESTKKHYLL